MGSAARKSTRPGRVSSLAEQILELQDSWDRLAADAADIEPTRAQRDELDRRLARHSAGPDTAAPWAVVRKRVRAGR